MSTSFIGQDGLPLGLRNNNPFNIRPNPNIHWEGQMGINNGYLIFIDCEHGIRAGAKDLHTKIAIDGLDTIRKYIPKFAPPSDNNFDANYEEAVSEKSGFGIDEILTPDEPTILKLVPAHIFVEVGADDYHLITTEIISAGVAMAFA